MDVNLSVNLHNDVIVTVKRDKRITNEVKSKNVLSDYFLRDVNGFKGRAVYSIFYGSGTGAPTDMDTKLFAQLGYVQVAYVSGEPVMEYDLTNGIGKATYKATIPTGTITGKTITEIALSSSTTLSETSIINHCLLSTPVTVGELDEITITVIITCNFPKNLSLLEGQIKLGKWLIGMLTGRTGATTGIGASTRAINIHSVRGLVQSQTPNELKATYTQNLNSTPKTLTCAYRVNANMGNFKDGIAMIEFPPSSGTSIFGLCAKKDCEWLADDVFVRKNQKISIGDGVTKDFMTTDSYVYDIEVFVDGLGVDAITHDAVIANQPYLFKLSKDDEFDIYGHEFIELVEYKGTDHMLQKSHQYMELRNVGDYTIFKNRYSQYGIKSIICGDAFDFFYLDDNSDWVKITSVLGSSTLNLSGNAASAEYFKMIVTTERAGQDRVFVRSISPMNPPTTNITFTEPPPAGSVITADYKLIGIPKTEDSVWDISFTFNTNVV